MTKLITFSILLIYSLSISSSDTFFPKNNSSFDIEDYRWLVGSWIGDGFGGVSEETWSEPIDGTMMGMYRHHIDGKIVFYEFLLLDKNGIRLKHFNPDITAWEEKEKFIEFEMINFSEHTIELNGLTFERKSETDMEIRLKLRQNGETHTEVFSMRRL